MTTPSLEQQAILAAEGNLIVEACPGSGKTTTLAMLCRQLPQNGSRHLALAFGKANAEDFKRKLPYWIESGTCHSVCKMAIDASWTAKPKITPDKVKFILKDSFPAVPWGARANIQRLVSLMKQQPQWEFTEDEVETLADAQGITCETSCFSQSVKVLAVSDEDRTRIDFDDMLRFGALCENVKFPGFATVMVDEAQDTNGIQHEVLRKLANNANVRKDTSTMTMVGLTPAQQEVQSFLSPRFIFVGDPNQAIYAFRGADAQAMGALRDAFNCKTLPLSISWRCSTSVVWEANRILGEEVVQAAPSAPTGQVKTGLEKGVWPERGSAVLCRNNAPLVAYAFHLLKAGLPVRILGRDLGQGLLKVIEKWPPGQNLQLEVNRWFEKESHKCKTEKQHAALDDKFNCLRALLVASPTLSDLKQKIETLFVADADSASCVTLATGHRAKGREWPHVFILDRHLMPSKWATEPWEWVQEKNLHFVMVTRAKENLTYITS